MNFAALLMGKRPSYAGSSDSLSRITAEPHPSHPGMNIYARNKDGSIAYRLCAIDSELSLFSADGTKYWAK